jgi:hypothetical protein
MTKKLFILLFLCCITKGNLTLAQFAFGLKGGINFSQLKTENQSFSNNFQQSLDTKTGYVGGVFFRFGNKIFVQPEFIFSAKGGSLNILKGGSTANTETVDIEYTSIDIPLLIGFRIGPLRLNAGPLASFKVSGKGLGDDLKQYSSDIGSSFKNAAYGYQAGGGIDFGSLSVDLRYEGSISDVSNLVDLTSKVNSTQKGKLFQLTVGLKLL